MMLAALALGLGLLLGWASGGSVHHLQRYRLQYEGPLVVAYLLQAVMRSQFFAGDPDLRSLVWSSCALMVAFIAARQDRLALFGLGSALNVLVVACNQFMPVTSSQQVDSAARAAAVASSFGFYRVMNEGHRLTLLGDVLPGFGGLLSLGDLVSVVGLVYFVSAAMQSPQR